MKKVSTFEEWQKLANEYDNLPDVLEWREREYSRYYDSENIKRIISLLKQFKNEPYKLMNVIRCNA